MDTNDRAFYLRRIRQEQEAARTAVNRIVRQRHEELANAYRLRCGIENSVVKRTPVLIAY